MTAFIKSTEMVVTEVSQVVAFCCIICPQKAVQTAGTDLHIQPRAPVSTAPNTSASFLIYCNFDLMVLDC